MRTAVMGLGEQILKLRDSSLVLFARGLHQHTYQLLLEPAISSARPQTFLPLPRTRPSPPKGAPSPVRRPGASGLSPLSVQGRVGAMTTQLPQLCPGARPRRGSA